MSSYRIVFDKACHLLVEIEHRAYWVVKKCNMTYDQAGQAILRKEFKVRQKVLLFNSRLKLIVGKLRSKWDKPFVATNVSPYGTIEVRDQANNSTFKVNGHQLKPYHEGLNLSANMGEVEVLTLIELVIPEDTAEENPDSPHGQLHCGQCTVFRM
ncbi:hypothetical protein CR513_03100, partial [Mucuna pruriens]